MTHRTKLTFGFLTAIALLYACTNEPPGPEYRPSPVSAASACRVVHITDGDTLDLKCPGRPQERIRLMGYDTPETYRARCPAERALGERATAFLRALTQSRPLTRIERHGHDRYGRVLARVWLGGENLADIMVGAGLALRYGGGQRANWCALING